jgi:hypothetical protein
MLLEIRGDAFFSDCGVGLIMVAVVVVEIWGEIPPLWGILWRSQRAEWYGVPRSCSNGLVSFIDAGDRSPTGGNRVRCTRIGGGVVERQGERSLTLQFALYISEIGGGKTGNNFVRSGAMVL